jgi:hypothetical protein
MIANINSQAPDPMSASSTLSESHLHLLEEQTHDETLKLWTWNRYSKHSAGELVGLSLLSL